MPLLAISKRCLVPNFVVGFVMFRARAVHQLRPDSGNWYLSDGIANTNWLAEFMSDAESAVGDDGDATSLQSLGICWGALEFLGKQFIAN